MATQLWAAQQQIKIYDAITGQFTTRKPRPRMKMDPRDIVGDFDSYFDIVPAYSDALRDEVYKIRYHVYAEELGWENTKQFPDEREFDEYDTRSIHCLLKHRPSDQFVGCVRLVLADPNDPTLLLPIEKLYDRPFSTEGFVADSSARRSFGEISRIAVLSKFRHRPGEQNIPDTINLDHSHHDPKGRRRFPHIALGLYLAAAAIGVSRDLTVVLAMMEPKLARRLRIFGIRFEKIGEPIDHHGHRAAYRLTRDSFEDSLSPPLRELLAFIRSKVDCETPSEP
ncbi:MAG: N-acyl amino acid synthase of PEP-CTERM/exosortase system [Gammaproteobacteria bacterium]